MRRVVTLVSLAALVLPATGVAVGRVLGDGTLHVNNAEGRVNFQRGFSGVVLGRVAVGRLEVIDPDSECDELAALVWDDDGWRERPLRGARDGVKCVFRTSDRATPMRFRLLEEDEIRISGTGLWLSAVGQGKVLLQGSETRSRDGTYSINGERPRSMPDRGAVVPVQARPSLP